MHILREEWCCELDYKVLRIRIFSAASECTLRACQIIGLNWHGIVEAQFGVIGGIINVGGFAKLLNLIAKQAIKYIFIKTRCAIMNFMRSCILKESNSIMWCFCQAL